MNSFSFGNKQKSLGPSLANTVGDEAANLQMWWCVTRCIVQVKQHTAMQLSSSLLFQCRSTFSNHISTAGSCNSPAVFKIVNQPRTPFVLICRCG